MVQRKHSVRGTRVSPRICVAMLAFVVTTALTLGVGPSSIAGATPPHGSGTGANYCALHGGGPNPATLQYMNVYACASYSGGNAPDGPTPFDSNGNESFQCVELVDRYLWAIHGIFVGPGDDDGNLDGSDLVQWIAGAHHLPYTTPTPSRLPVPGDVVSFSPGDGYDSSAGHTAIVYATVPQQSEFKILSENWLNGEPGTEIIKVGSGSNAGRTEYSDNGGRSWSGEWDPTRFLEIGSSANLVWITTPSTSTSPPNATVGSPYSFKFSASGGTGSYSWSVASGSLPPGLSMSSAGVIAGTPSAVSKLGPFTVKVTSGSLSSEQAFSIWALAASVPALSITTPSTSTSPPNATVGSPYSFKFSASGGTGSYSWSVVSGSLPPGLSMSSAGVIAGTPSAVSKLGPFTVKVTSGGQAAEKSFTIWALG